MHAQKKDFDTRKKKIPLRELTYPLLRGQPFEFLRGGGGEFWGKKFLQTKKMGKKNLAINNFGKKKSCHQIFWKKKFLPSNILGKKIPAIKYFGKEKSCHQNVGEKIIMPETMAL